MRAKHLLVGVAVIIGLAVVLLALKPSMFASQQKSQAFSMPAFDAAMLSASGCPRGLVTLPLDSVTLQSQVAQDRRSAKLTFNIRFAQERYTSAWLTKMQPRTSQPDASWYNVGAVACPRGPDESGPTSVGEAKGTLDVIPQLLGGICQGSSGIALLSDSSIRRLPGTALICAQSTPAPSPEGKIISGIYLDNCVRQNQMWVCRRRPVYLHTTGKSECGRWLIEDVHEFQAFMTAGAGEGDQRVNVQNMTLAFSISNSPDRGTQNCQNTSWCAKTIKHYNLACRGPRSVSSTARHDTAAWRSQVVSW